MRNIDIIVMGKTGAGKSTLINAVLGEKAAPVGSGQTRTKENHVYEKKVSFNENSYNLRMYDTVGLEIDDSITNKTLSETRLHITSAKKEASASDIHLVWFCVNYRSHRLENYEIDLIRKMSLEYEIPFVIVLTKAIYSEEGELVTTISRILPELPQRKVLAQDYPVRTGVIEAFGVKELLQASITEYTTLKGDILEKKLRLIDMDRARCIRELEMKGKILIDSHVSLSKRIGFVPVGCIPFVHGICVKMIKELNDLVGIKFGKTFADDIFGDVVLGIIATPFMMVPLISSVSASAYVRQVGEDYLKVAIKVIDLSTDRELQDNQLLKQRIKKEMQQLQKGR